MRTYEIKVYGAKWEVIAEDIIHAENSREADMQEDRIAERYRDCGYEVSGTSRKAI